MKQNINEIGNTPRGIYALGQVAGRAYDRMLNGTKKSVGDGVVALNPKYGKVAQDAAYAAAGGYMDWREKFKEKNGREPSDEECRAWMQNYHNGCNDYGKPDLEKKGIARISESQLQDMITKSIKKNLNESKTNKNMKKNTIKLNENALKQIIAESVKKVLNEHMSNQGYCDMEDLMLAITSLISSMNDIRYYVRDESVQNALRDFQPHFSAFAQAMRKYCDENGLVMNS